MSRIPFCFLVYFGFACMVVRGHFLLPVTVGHPDALCGLLEFPAGACMHFMYETGEFDCRNLICGQQLLNVAGTHLAHNVGRAVDGTVCGERKICHEGKCVPLSSAMDMPQQVGENKHPLKCHRLSQGKPRYHVR